MRTMVRAEGRCGPRTRAEARAGRVRAAPVASARGRTWPAGARSPRPFVYNGWRTVARRLDDIAGAHAPYERERGAMSDTDRLRRAATRLLAPVLRPAAFLVLFLTEVLLVESGSLSAMALAATAAAGSALLVCSVISARCAVPVPRTRVRTALRDREKRTAFLPQRDPDAKGRTRPRAPGAALLTAA